MTTYTHERRGRQPFFVFKRDGVDIGSLNVEADIPFDGELAEKVAAVFAEHEQAMAEQSDIAPPATLDGPQPGEVWLHDGERITITHRGMGSRTVYATSNAVPCGLYLISELTRPPVVDDKLTVWRYQDDAGAFRISLASPGSGRVGELLIWSDGDVTWESYQ